jgi:hypothetical protein
MDEDNDGTIKVDHREQQLRSKWRSHVRAFLAELYMYCEFAMGMRRRIDLGGTVAMRWSELRF